MGESLTSGQKAAICFFTVAALGAAVYAGDIIDPFEKDVTPSAIHSDTTVTTASGAIAVAGFEAIPGLTCSGPVETVTVDDRSVIKGTHSFMKAIDANLPGSQASSMNPGTVYSLARASAVASGHPELLTMAQLDNFPVGDYRVPTDCRSTDVKGATILAIAAKA